MDAIKTKVGKPVQPDKLKGTKLEDFLFNAGILSKVGNIFSPLRGEKSRCWVCESEDNNDFLTVHGIEYVQCGNCSHVYQKYIVPDKEVYDYLAKDKEINCHVPQEQFDHRGECVSLPMLEEVMELRRERDLSVDSGRWLDIGFGAGDLLYQVKKKYSWDVEGFDIGAPGVEMAKKHGITAYMADIYDYCENINPGKRKFDVISARGYFDLVTYPLKQLKMITKLLKPKGTFLISQPCYQSFTLDLIKTSSSSALRYCNAFQRSGFTEKSIQTFLENAGLKVIFKWKYGLDFYTFMSMTTSRMPELANSNINKFFVKHYNEFQAIIDKHGYSDCMLYVGQAE